MILTAKNVVKEFGKFRAVSGVSFEIQEGECFGLLGPNGAGKSTMISMIYGAARRTAGELAVFGMDPEHDGRKIKRRMGIVTQENALDESMTVVENMRVFAGYCGVPEASRAGRIDELLEFMSLSHKRNDRIKALSGGMQRRLVFVRALLPMPDFVILDEPTTGLDPAVRHLLWDKIKELKAKGVTILLTTHYMDEAERLCHRLVIMDGGMIKAEGKPRSLIDQFCPGFVAYFGSREKEKASAAFAASDHDADFSMWHEMEGVCIRGSELESLTKFVSRHHLVCDLIRPSNLEDVFLHVTGKGLSSNA
jgi:lipooligosaccharide transport system ATP-binding protein